jgi:hypothetical protein
MAHSRARLASMGRLYRPSVSATSSRIEAAIDAFLGEFTLADLERACPGVSRDKVIPLREGNIDLQHLTLPAGACTATATQWAWRI